MERGTNYDVVWNEIQVNTDFSNNGENTPHRGSIAADKSTPTAQETADQWLQKALERPDANELFVHGSQQQFLSFSQPQLWRGELIFFSRLSDKINLDQFYGDTLYLCKIADAPEFNPATDRQASKMLTRLGGVFARKRSQLEYEDLPHVVPQAVRAGHRRFRVHDERTGEFYQGVADARLATIVEVRTVDWGTHPRRQAKRFPEVAPVALVQAAEQHRGARILRWPTHSGRGRTA